jgi:phosphatidylglycerophosphate synthase
VIANVLTALRLLLALPVALACADPALLSPLLLVALVAIAVASDYFDGKLARRYGTASSRGMLFDHSVDFLFVTSALFGAAVAGVVTVWLPVLIVMAFSQYVFDSYWLYRQKQLRMSFLGRWNGVFYFVPVVLLALSRLEPVSAFEPVLVQLLWWLSVVLLFSTGVSIADRAIAPWRSR